MAITGTSSIWRNGTSRKRALIVLAAAGATVVALNPVVSPGLMSKAAAASCPWVGSAALYRYKRLDAIEVAGAAPESAGSP